MPRRSSELLLTAPLRKSVHADFSRHFQTRFLRRDSYGVSTVIYCMPEHVRSPRFKSLCFVVNR